jgi:protein-disulfide isomerase
VKRDRLLLLAGAVIAAAVVVVVIALLAGGSDTSAGSGGTTPVTTSSLGGVPQDGATLGAADAPATLDVYEDPQCPYCRQWALDALPATVGDYVKTGRVKLVYRGVNIIGPNSEQGLRAIYAAGLQDKLWEMADALYRVQGDENSGWITDDVIRDAASAAGADPDAVLEHMSDESVTTQLRRAGTQAIAEGVQGTPTFVLRRALAPPQQLQLTALDAASFEAALESALQ